MMKKFLGLFLIVCAFHQCTAPLPGLPGLPLPGVPAPAPPPNPLHGIFQGFLSHLANMFRIPDFSLTTSIMGRESVVLYGNPAMMASLAPMAMIMVALVMGVIGSALGSLFALGDFDRRRRRDVEENKNAFLISDDMLESYFGIIEALDEQQCGKRMVCEVSAKDSGKEEKMSSIETILVAMFKREEPKPDDKKHKSKAAYDSSFLLGKKEGKSSCAKMYSKCKFSADKIFRLLHYLSGNRD